MRGTWLRSAWVMALSVLIVASLATVAAAEVTTIRWLYPGGEQPVSQQTWKSQIERFAKVHPEIKVEVIDVPWDLAHDRIVNMVMAGDGPDLIQMGSRWIPEFAEMGALMPLDQYFGKEKMSLYYPGLVKTVTYKGKLYALPRAYSTQALIYRTDLIKNPPKTWDEVVTISKKIQSEHPGMYGLGIGGANHVSTLSQYFTILYTYGGRVFDEQGRLQLDSPEAVAALKRYVDFYRKDKIVPNPLEYNREQLPELFSAGRIAMFVSGPWGGRALGLPPDNDRIPYASAPVPAGPAGTATELVSDSTGIWAGTRNLKAALTFLDFITSPEEQVQRDLIGGLVPQGPTMATRPEFTKNPFFKTFIDMAPHGVPQPQPALWEPFQEVIVNMVQSATLGMVTPEQAVKQAVQELRAKGLVPAEKK
ncbi:sugar ABC transporter substrate-binding protein [Carboxydochorda subterranea]|uniref:Maltodextrin-binding protein n=1 Tax=Carboxydichorda subterranea TaxID=3109565 RepID=A0ABZ1BXN6_9FIRM|nr:sugar ABC transporter substrate-binding protein [Limnochorda sp. L945t]WRP17562.1 sugar ABC transporter substrate-binding protein [Limnochorda sp. L945t]